MPDDLETRLTQKVPAWDGKSEITKEQWQSAALKSAETTSDLRVENNRLRQKLAQAEAQTADAINCLLQAASKAELGVQIMRDERPESKIAEGFEVVQKYAEENAQRLRQKLDEAKRPSTQGDQ